MEVMIRICIVLLLSLSSAHAAVIEAASSSYADVNTAVGTASNGDTVIIPAGNSTWTSMLDIPVGITVQGAGVANTQITASGLTGPVLSFDMSGVTAYCRLTQLRFSGPTSYPLVELDGSGTDKQITFRIDNCFFKGGKRAINPVGWTLGVIDNNTFSNCNIAVGFDGDRDNAWARTIEAGAGDSVYIEDNVFVLDDNVSTDPNEQIYHASGCRSVTRYNAFDSTAMTGYSSVIYDTHGNWPLSSPVDPDDENADYYRGQPIVEVYGNTIDIHHSYRYFNLRGGSMIIYSNTLTYASGGKPTQFELTEEESWQTVHFSPLRSAWPASDQVSNTFFWANTINAGAAVPSLGHPAESQDALFIHENRDYWLQAPNATNGSPAGVYSNYTAYTYPHPFRSWWETHNPSVSGLRMEGP